MRKWNWRLYLGFFALSLVLLVVSSRGLRYSGDDAITQLFKNVLSAELAELSSDVVIAAIAALGLNSVVSILKGGRNEGN